MLVGDRHACQAKVQIVRKDMPAQDDAGLEPSGVWLKVEALQEFGDTPFGGKPPVSQHNHHVGEARNLVERMGDVEDGYAERFPAGLRCRS